VEIPLLRENDPRSRFTVGANSHELDPLHSDLITSKAIGSARRSWFRTISTSGFPPTLIQGGTREIFLSNFVHQYQALVQAGVPATLDLYEGMVHVFQPLAADSLEGRAAMKQSVGFWNADLRAKPPAR
jgi:acetyl esterase/lipase